MAVPASGNPVTILGFAREKVYDSYSSDYPPHTGGTNKFPYPLDGLVWAPDAGATRSDLYRDTAVFCPVNHVANSGGSLRMEASSANGYTGTYNNASYKHTPATRSETWTFSFWARSSASVTARTYMFSAKSTGLMIGNHVYNYPNPYGAYTSVYHSVTTGWERFSHTLQVCSSTSYSNDCAYVQARCDVIGSSDIVWYDGFQLEEASEETDFSMNGPYAIGDLVNGTGTNSSITFESTNTNSSEYPDTGTDNEWADWYDYDHDAEGGGGET